MGGEKGSDTAMKRYGLALAVVLCTAAAARALNTPEKLSADCYYTWGIDPRDVVIPNGFIITQAVVTLHGLTSVSENPADTLAVYLLDNPPVGFHANIDIPGVDHFAPHGCPLISDYADRTKGLESLVCRLSEIDDPASWVWRIYGRPFSLQLPDATPVKFSSALLELIDYVGNGTPFGIGLDPEGTDDFELGGISLTLTLQAFQGPPQTTQLTFRFGTNNPPTLFAPALLAVFEGQDMNISFSPFDPDGDPVHLSCTGLPAGAAFDNGTLSWTPSYETTSRGSSMPFAVNITAHDGFLSTSSTFFIWVLDTNRPPVLTALTLIAEEKTTLTYRLDTIDPDGDSITCQAMQLPPGAAFDPSTLTVRWDTTAAPPGVYDATFSVSDGLLEQTRTFSLDSRSLDRTKRQGSLRLR